MQTLIIVWINYGFADIADIGTNKHLPELKE